MGYIFALFSPPTPLGTKDNHASALPSSPPIPRADGGEEIINEYMQWYSTAAENTVLQVGFDSTY